MTENTPADAPIVVTLKGGAGFEAPWLVLRAQSAEDAVALLAETEFADLPTLVGKYAASFREKVAGAPSASGAQSGGSPSPQRGASPRGRQASSGAPAPRQASAEAEYHPEGEQCPADGETLVYKKINAKSGKTFEMWVCPNQRSRGDGHASQFIN